MTLNERTDRATEGHNDAEWGRRRGAEPPLPARAPLMWWGAMAVVLTVVVVAVVGGPGPLDDPNPGKQRPGFLVDADDARVVRGLLLPGDPVGRRPVFLAFDRKVPRPDALRGLLRVVPDRFAAVLAVAPGRAIVAPKQGRFIVVVDTGGRLARAVGLDRPKDGGPPIGYAVIDAGARVRYATLDPTWTEQGFEVAIVANAAR